MIDTLIELAIEAGITIREIYESGKFSTSIKSDRTPVTTADEEANKIILEGLPIADVNHPRLPYDYFDEIFRKIGISNIQNEILLKIFQYNISIRKKILDESQLIENEVSKTLTKLILYEINLISSQH